MSVLNVNDSKHVPGLGFERLQEKETQFSLSKRKGTSGMFRKTVQKVKAITSIDMIACDFKQHKPFWNFRNSRQLWN